MYRPGGAPASFKAMMLRFLQTLAEVGAGNNTTVVFPVPIELMSSFIESAKSERKADTDPT